MAKSFPKSKRIIHRIAAALSLAKPANTDLEAVVDAIDVDLQQPLRLSAALVPDSKLYIRASQILAGDGGSKSVSSLGPLVPSLGESWIDFQAQTTSGLDVIITFPTSTVGNYRRCAFSLTTNNTLVAAFSSESATLSALPNAGSLFQGNSVQIGWVDLQCTHSSGRFKTADSATSVIENAKIYRVAAGGGGSAASGLSQEFSIGSGLDTFTVTFASPLASTNYIAYVQIENDVDANPQFLIPVLQNKTVNGFTVQLNAPTDSANYKLIYLIPAIQVQQGEANISNGQSSVSVTLPMPLDNTNFGVVAQLINYVDGAPQFQPVVVISKTTGGFTAKWNDPVDSSNYRLAYQVAYFS